MRGWLRAGAVLLLALATFGLPIGASAHDVLLSTSPAAGSTVSAVPESITLTFNLPALNIGSVVQVVGPAGDIADGKPRLVDREVRQAIRPGAPGGAYQVLWRITSADGHPISGAFRFTARAGAGGSAGATSAIASPSPQTSGSQTSGPQTSGPQTSGPQPSVLSAPSDSSTSVPTVAWVLIGVVALLAGGGLLLVTRGMKSERSEQ